MLFMNYDQGGALATDRKTSLTLFSAQTFVDQLLQFANWLRIKYVNGTTTLSFYSSADGKHWTLMGSETVAAFIANKPTRVGFGVSYNRNTGDNQRLSCGYLALV
jgi:hypothetical protein